MNTISYHDLLSSAVALCPVPQLMLDSVLSQILKDTAPDKKENE